MTKPNIEIDINNLAAYLKDKAFPDLDFSKLEEIYLDSISNETPIIPVTAIPMNIIPSKPTYYEGTNEPIPFF